MRIIKQTTIREILVGFDESVFARFSYDGEWLRIPSHPGGSGGWKSTKELAYSFYDRCNPNIDADALAYLLSRYFDLPI